MDVWELKDNGSVNLGTANGDLEEEEMDGLWKVVDVEVEAAAAIVEMPRRGGKHGLCGLDRKSVV